MSRYIEGDGDEWTEGQQALWNYNAARAIAGKRGQQALADLRDALRALPEKRIIARALCTVGAAARAPQGVAARNVGGDFDCLVAEQGEGVCAVGAYVWWQKIKAGMDAAQAFAAVPTLPDYDYGIHDTAREGTAAGLTGTLAWLLAYHNDDSWATLTPEARYGVLMGWIEDRIGQPASAVEPWRS